MKFKQAVECVSDQYLIEMDTGERYIIAEDERYNIRFIGMATDLLPYALTWIELPLAIRKRLKTLIG